MGHTTKDSKHNSETIEKVITELNNNTELTNNIKTEVINLQSKMAAGGASAITIDQVNNAPANSDFQTSFNSHLKPDMLSSVGAEVGAQIDGDTVLKNTLKDKLDIDALETHVATKVSITGLNDGSTPDPAQELDILYHNADNNVYAKTKIADGKALISKNGSWETKELAEKDLSNVNVGSTNVDKILQVKTDGSLKYIDLPAIPTRKDITSTYLTRRWLETDIGKKIYIHWNAGSDYISAGIIGNTFTGGTEGMSAQMGVERQSSIYRPLWYSTDTTEARGKIYMQRSATQIVPHDITKFEIEEI